VNIIDQRMAGSPPITTGMGANGTIEVIVGDALTGMFNNGKLDKVMGRYGANRRVTVG